MHVDAIRHYCLSFPGAKENLQWEDNLCFKVDGKIFAILGLDSVPQRFCCKCAPEKFEELLEHEDIRAAPYLGRYKWIMLDRLDALPPEELRELIRESYAMVSTKVKKPKPDKRGFPKKTKKRKK